GLRNHGGQHKGINDYGRLEALGKIGPKHDKVGLGNRQQRKPDDRVRRKFGVTREGGEVRDVGQQKNGEAREKPFVGPNKKDVSAKREEKTESDPSRERALRFSDVRKRQRKNQKRGERFEEIEERAVADRVSRDGLSGGGEAGKDVGIAVHGMVV